MLRLDFEVFFFGTAIFLSLLRSPCARPDCLDNNPRRFKRLSALSVQLVFQSGQGGKGRCGFAGAGIIVFFLDDIDKIAGKVLDAIRAPIEFNGNDCSVGGSVGISVSPDHANDEDGLIKAADEVMYAVKQAGRNDYRIYGRDVA